MAVRAVLDTNILVSGLCFAGPPRSLLRLALQGKIDLFTSAALIAEFERVMALKFPRRRVEIIGTLNELSLLWEIIPDPALPRLTVIKADPSDDRVLECALGAEADCIVSGDKHLLSLRSFRNIPVLSPAELLARLS